MPQSEKFSLCGLLQRGPASTSSAKGSGLNKYAILGVEAPAWQGARKANS